MWMIPASHSVAKVAAEQGGAIGQGAGGGQSGFRRSLDRGGGAHSGGFPDGGMQVL